MVRVSHSPDMTSAFFCGRKAINQTKQNWPDEGHIIKSNKKHIFNMFSCWISLCNENIGGPKGMQEHILCESGKELFTLCMYNLSL